ncbi:MAG: hypothetical protein KDC67_05165, partial [Ignavibacteriae bacterium]|nr:hypothetical protein [Ignavibacteriota bacterium]
MNNSTTDGYFLFFYRHRAQLKAVIETLRFFEMKGDEIKLTTTDFSLKKLDQLNNIGSLNTRKNTLKRISGIFRFLFRSPIFCWLLSWKTTWHINSKIKKIHSLLINNNIKGLLVCGDRGFPEELLFCYLAKKHEIPVYLLPNSFPATIYSMNLVREPFLYNELPPSFITSMIPAKNIKKLKERSFYYYKPSDALSLTRLNVFPEDPWVNGNSYASIIFLEKQNDLLNYNNNSQSVSKIVVGHPELDSLWKNLHEQEKKPMKLIKKYSINPNLPIIVIALPQHGEHRLCSWEKHWQIINNIRKSIENKEMNFLISLHPKMDPNM